MTIDERLERLTERHEALTQTVELLMRQSQAHDRQIGELTSIMTQLVGIVRSHENRIDRLEGQ
jgi:hypothetical protein